MQRFDAIVVGAGPAGSTTAYRLARGGASVLLLDRARFPRDKPCGGGLTMRAVGQLPFAVDPVVEDVVDRFELGFRYHRRFERRATTPLVLMTQRRRLDAFLAERAADAGAEFRDGVRVDAVEADGDGATVVLGTERIGASLVVGADGANGVTVRTAGIDAERDHGVALEGNVSYGVVDEERWRGRALIELGTVEGGYAWIFPKGDHVNVGVGGWQREGPKLRDHLKRLCDAYGIPEDAVRELRGHRLPLRRPRAALGNERVLLVGDAAGLVDPLSGDGMYEALLSGKLAAESGLELLAGRVPTLAGYGRALSSAVGALLSASWGAKLAFDRFPRLTYAIARTPFVFGVVEGVLRGELGHPKNARGPVKAPLRLLEALSRAAGDPGRPFRAELST